MHKLKKMAHREPGRLKGRTASLVILLFRYFFFLLLLPADNGFSQQNSKEVETKSYELYLQKKWDELISFGNEALDNKVDYFYLRMRIGIAYYEKGRYRAAQKHFWKALEFNSSDDTAMEYLYYSTIFSSQFEEGRKLTKKFSKDLVKKLKTESLSPVNFLFVEGGTKQSSRSDLFSPPRYIHFGLGHPLGKTMSLTHAFTGYMQPLPGQPFVVFNQNQYYLKSNISIVNTWLFSPSVHLISKKFKPNQPPPRGNGPNPQPPKEIIRQSALVSASLRKSFSWFDVKISSSWFSERTILPVFQQGASFSYFPFANNTLSLAANGFFISDKNDQKNYTAKSFTAALSAAPKIRLSLNYLLNESINLNEDNGYIVNNTSDLTTSRISLLSDFSLSNHISVYLLLMRENKLQAEKNISYYYNSAIIGLKIIP